MLLLSAWTNPAPHGITQAVLEADPASTVKLKLDKNLNCNVLEVDAKSRVVTCLTRHKIDPLLDRTFNAVANQVTEFVLPDGYDLLIVAGVHEPTNFSLETRWA